MHQICTIVATNYIPQALAFLKSVREFHPETPCIILVTDASSIEHALDAFTELITTSEIGVDPSRVSKMETYYDQVEFATSLKPYLLKHLLSQGAESVTFLDPDTQLYGNIESIFELSRRFDAILTPHRLSPFKQNPEFYSETTFLRYGTYNLGFISVGQSSLPLLNWWCERLEFDSTRYLNDHIFTDQKWVNQFPAYFNCHIHKGPDLNLAPWNLDERDLRLSDGKLKVGDIPLKMIHFSQMSSSLAAGGTTKLWEISLDESRESKEVLTLINKITAEYKNRLCAFSSYENFITLVKKPSQPRYAAFYRDSIRKREKEGRKPASSLFRITLSAIAKLKILDRSETFSAIIRYLPADISKILIYFSFDKRSRRLRRPKTSTGGRNFLNRGKR